SITSSARSRCRVDSPAAPHKLEKEAREQIFVMAVSVRDRTNPINSTAMRLEPLGARATHVMTFRAVTLDWLEHWRSPSPINCPEAVSTGNANWLSTPQRATTDADAVGLAPNGSTLPVPLSA